MAAPTFEEAATQHALDVEADALALAADEELKDAAIQAESDAWVARWLEVGSAVPEAEEE